MNSYPHELSLENTNLIHIQAKASHERCDQVMNTLFVIISCFRHGVPAENFNARQWELIREATQDVMSFITLSFPEHDSWVVALVQMAYKCDRAGNLAEDY